MNEFIVVDSEGFRHWILTCTNCLCLFERDNMERHIERCVITSVGARR